MALLQPSEWQAERVGLPAGSRPVTTIPKASWIWHPAESRVWCMAYFRKLFTVPAGKKVLKATLKLSVSQTIIVHLYE